MRKILSLGLSALILSFISTALSAGYEVCDDPDLKPDLQEAGIYGWCNAWHDAEEGDKARIAERIRARAEDSDVEVDLTWLDEQPPTSCPCWTYDVVVQDVACSGYVITFQQEDAAGYDAVYFGLGGYRQFNPGLALLAGFTFFDNDEFPECVYGENGGVQTLLATGTVEGSLEDDACRLDILNLIADPPQLGDCEAL